MPQHYRLLRVTRILERHPGLLDAVEDFIRAEAERDGVRSGLVLLVVDQQGVVYSRRAYPDDTPLSDLAKRTRDLAEILGDKWPKMRVLIDACNRTASPIVSPPITIESESGPVTFSAMIEPSVGRAGDPPLMSLSLEWTSDERTRERRSDGTTDQP